MPFGKVKMLFVAACFTFAAMLAAGVLAPLAEEGKSSARVKEIIDEALYSGNTVYSAKKALSEFSDEHFRVRCVDISDTGQITCARMLKMLAKDTRVLDALKKINDAGVSIYIDSTIKDFFSVLFWVKKIYINREGNLIIYHKASLSDMQKFLGIPPPRSAKKK